MHKAVFEVLEHVNDAPDEQLAEALVNACKKHPRIIDILFYGLSDNVEFALPEGEPPFRANNEVNTHSLLWSEARRLYLFTKSKDIKDNRRQQLFIEMLEFIHPDDAQLIISMKDRKWPYPKITKDLVKQVIPGLLELRLLANGNRG